MNRNVKTYNRYFHFILYKDDQSQMEAMDYITQNFEYARICHDKDIIEEGEEKGELKKPHYHIVIKTGKNPRNRSALAKETKVKENYIEGCSHDAMLLYLIHYNNPNKTQYDIDEVDGELATDLQHLIESRCNTQQEKLEKILKKIYSDTCTLTEITNYCIKNNYYTVLKQNQYLIQQLIRENRGIKKDEH